MLDVCEQEFLVLLFVVEAEDEGPQGLLRNTFRKEQLAYRMVDPCTVVQNLGERWSG